MNVTLHMSLEKTVEEFLKIPEDEMRRLAKEQLKRFRERERARKEASL